MYYQLIRPIERIQYGKYYFLLSSPDLEEVSVGCGLCLFILFWSSFSSLISSSVEDKSFKISRLTLLVHLKKEGWVWVFLDTSDGYAGVHGSCQTPSASPTGPGDPRRPGARRPSKDRYPRGAPRSFPPCSETKYRGGKSNQKGV
ncbi:Hypothetical_protein [Hexamita inflata]|uniref:Hypothetical_protein n=1 Tax=Hexamita inflata TaxID=28002 RepID=A0AA86NCF4_9EUKA|nr:Hypothetical protein HINF_LOCUS4842 [Hexamita inflata]